MHGLALLLGHLIGDYLFQHDWEARLKVVRRPEGPRPEVPAANPLWTPIAPTEEEKAQAAWDQQARDARLAPWACTWHCLSYTLACLVTTWWFLPWWAYLVIFLAHWPADRWGLARVLMRYNGQENFATGPLSPWSVVVVDNTIHLIVLYVLGMLAVL